MSIAATAAAQETRGQILGRITDPSGAVVAGVTVRAVNVETNVPTTTKTGATGDYLLPFLNPGAYTITAEQAGFKSTVREGITVRVSEQITVDLAMEIGAQVESVRVVAGAPLIEAASSSVGQVVDHERIVLLPLKDGAALMLANLAPGVLNLTDGGWTRPYDDGTISAVSINGSRTANTDFTLDGASNVGRASVAYVPPADTIQEFKVNTVALDASLGNALGGSVNLSLKSGTNDLHGSDYYFMQNPALNANKFFSNRGGQAKPAIRAHRFGLHNSGPVMLPRLYDGRNRTFWMYGFEGIRGEDPRGTYTTAVPLPAQRNGDFSQLSQLGPNYRIYDPQTTRPAPNGRYTRDAFPDNIIPASRINPTSRAIMEYWPLPNLPGTADGANNWSDPQMEWDHYYSTLFRVDHSAGDRHRMYFRGNVNRRNQEYSRRFGDSMGNKYWLGTKGFAVDHVMTATPTLLFNTRFSLSHNYRGTRGVSQGMDLTKLGFSSTYIEQLKQFDQRGIKYPQILVSGYGELGGTWSLDSRADDNLEFGVNATRIISAHTVRVGMNFRDYRENTMNFGQGSGTFSFGSGWTTGPFDNSPGAPMGQSLASFLLGVPTGGGIDINGSAAQRSAIWAGYIQDDWKITRKLSLNLGLRYETETPTTERYNRTILDYDFDVVNPLDTTARARYAAGPVPEVPVEAFHVMGGIRFPGVDGAPRGLWNRDTNNFMPRVGFAWQLTNRTVVRSGVGMFYQLIGIPRMQVRQVGFSKQTAFVASVDNGQTFAANITNPFPTGVFDAPPGAARGLLTEVGNGITVFNHDLKTPYSTRWHFSVQRQLTRKSVVEISYVGSKTVKMQAAKQFNSIPEQYFSRSPLRDDPTINYLSQQFRNPFYPDLARTAMSGTNVPRSQLLRPYPHFTGITMDTNQGYAWYHSLQTRVERRFDNGFTANANWTYSKSMEALSYLNPFDPLPNEVISDQDRTHRMTCSGIYEMPFGRGKAFASGTQGIAGKLISGWTGSWIYQYQSGAPIGFGNVIFYGQASKIALAAEERTVDRWFNTEGFERNSARQLSSNVRTFPTRFSGLRTDSINNWDISVVKRTRLNERITSEFRTDFTNAMNRAQFAGPNTSPTSSAFGAVTSEAQWPRTIQFSLKLVY
jgi:hypothetical protein